MLIAATITGEAVAAFTLPEVLLTLTIVAVVASLTIPPLVNNVQQAQFNAGVWTAENMLVQATEQIQANQGIVHVGSITGTDGGYGMKTDFCSVLQCIRTDTTNNIFPANTYFYKSSLYGTSNVGDLNAAVILSNGYYIQFWSNANCNIGNNNDFTTGICGAAAVDINGSQGPNMSGEDVYLFWIGLKNGVYLIIPDGQENGNTCYVGNGAGCTYQRLYNPNNMP